MSLKAFHIVFISLSTLMALGVGIWGLVEFFQEGGLFYLLFGISSILAGIGLVYYGKYVLRKLKDISYL